MGNAFDDFTPAQPATGEVSQEGINLADRAYQNMQHGFYEGTLAGGGLEAGQVAMSDEAEAARLRKIMAERQAKFEKLQVWWQRWNKDDLTLYDLGAGAAEGMAALGGQLAGSLPTPENFIPIPGARQGVSTAVRLARPRLTSALVHGSSAAAINIASDPAVQAMSIYKGTREHYDPLQTVIGGALGAFIGSGFGAAFPSRATDIAIGSSVKPHSAPSPPVYMSTPELTHLYSEMTALPKMQSNWKAVVQASKQEIANLRQISPAANVAMRADPKVALYELYLTRPDFLEVAAPQAKQQLDSLFETPGWKDVIDSHRAIAQERVAAYASTLDSALNDIRFRTAAGQDPNQGQTFHEMKRGAAGAGRTADTAQADRVVGEPGPREVADAIVGRLVERLKVSRNALNDGGDFQGLVEVLYGKHASSTSLNRLKTALDGVPRDKRGEVLLRYSKKVGHVADAVRVAVGGDPSEEPIITVLRAYVGAPDILAHVDSPFYDRLAHMLRDRYPIDAALIDEARKAMFRGTWKSDGSLINSLPLDPVSEPNLSAPRRPAEGLGDPHIADKGLAPTNPELPSPASIIHNISRSLGLTIRQGGIRGSVRYQNGVLRVRNSKDMPMVIGGAAVHITQTQMTRNAAGFRMFTTALGPHLRQLKNTSPLFANVADAAGTGKVTEDELAMDFANFVYLYVMNPPLIEKNYRGLAQQFDTFYQHNDPQMLRSLQQTRRDLQAYFSMPSQDALAARVVSAGRKSVFHKMGKAVEDLGYDTTFGAVAAHMYQGIVDDLHPIQVATRNLARLYRENTGKTLNLDVSRDPYKLARMSRGAGGAAVADLRYGVSDYRELTPQGPALVDALEFATGSKHWEEGAVETFGRYLVSLRLLTEWRHYYDGKLPGPPDMETPGALLTIVDEMEAAHPTFRQAAMMVHEFTRRMWQKKRDAGFLTQEQYEAQLGRPFFVPLARDVDEKTRLAIGKMGGTGSKGVVFRFLGSDRDIINPIHALMFDTYATALNIAENDVRKGLLQMAEGVGPEGARIVERLKLDNTPDGQGVVSISGVLENAQKYDGLGPLDANLIQNVLGDHFGAKGAVGKSPAGEGTIHYAWIDGQKVGMRFADGQLGRDLAFTLAHMNVHTRDVFMKMVAAPTSFLQMTITGTTEFAAATLMRNQFASWAVSRHYTPLLTAAKGIKSEITQDVASEMYARTYGIFGGVRTANVHEARINAELGLLERKGYLMQRLEFFKRPSVQTFKEFMRLTELPETGDRLGLFKTVFALKKKEGLSDYEAAMEASYHARDLMDYNRRGSRMQHATRLILFLNPYVQGMDKFNRTMIIPAIRHLQGDILTKQEREELPQAMITFSRVMMIGMIGAAQAWLYHDDEEYNNISDYYRSFYWVFRGTDGAWVSIPKPFELAVASNIFERSIEYAYRNDPLALDKVFSGVVDLSLPPLSNPLYNVGVGAMYGIDARSGNELIPMSLQGVDPEMQYTEATSEMAKRIGKAIGVSPIMVDYSILNLTGTWGRDTLSYTNRLIDANRPEKGVDDAWVSRRFIRDWSRGSVAAKEFWDRVAWKGGRMAVAARAFHLRVKDGNPEKASQYLGTLPEDEQLYAMMSEMGRATLRMHPMERASEVARTLSKMRREMLASNEPYLQKVNPQQKRMIDDIMSELSAKEMHNALVLTGARGYENRKMFDALGTRDLIEKVSPEVYSELLTRINKAHVIEWQVVKDFWPKVRAEVQRNGLSKLKSEMLSPFPETFDFQMWKAESQSLTGQRPLPNAFSDF